MARRTNGVASALVALAAVVVIGLVAWGAVALSSAPGTRGEAPSHEAGEAAPQEAPVVSDRTDDDADADDPDQAQGDDEGAAQPADLDSRVEEVVSEMTLEEKVAQLFVVRPEDVTGVGTQVAAGEATRAALERYPVGGICYFAKNLEDPAQTRSLLANTQAYYEELTGLPCLLAVDEEGGTVARIGSNPAFGVPWVGNMSQVGSVEDARAAAVTVGGYLSDLGFNLDFAPDADIADVEGSSLALRSFGDTAEEVAPRVAAQVEGYLSQGVLCCAKHFPGIGGAVGDSHDGAIFVDATIDELRVSELVPFEAAIDAGVPLVMVGHLSVPNVTGNDLAASLNPDVVTGILRDELGYDGVVITDSLAMGAVVEEFPASEIGVRALLAGVDLVLMPADFEATYQGVLDAVADGTLSEERIDESVSRVVRLKLDRLA